LRVVFVRPIGERSTRLAALARHTGQDAAGLAGGIVAWRDAGHPLEASPRS
jgi:rhodanese-related sulfurtransferase